MRLSVLLLSALWLATSACAEEDLPPHGQLLLYVDTDAPLPPPPGSALSDDEPAALFDSLLIDVFEPDASEPCTGCSRVFAVNRSMFSAGPASFGIPSRPAVEGYRARLRLYHSEATLNGAVLGLYGDDTPPQSVIDLTVSLPAPAEEGIIERAVLLTTESVGLPRGTLDSPEATSAGSPQASQVGSWSHAARVDCSAEPRPGQVCVPGGAYWMGNPRARGTTLGDAADRRRLVALRPFYMDGTEVTVAQYRLFDDGSQHQLVEWSGASDGLAWPDFCTFTASPGPHEDKPMMCVSYDGARAYCQARGGDLPTEAQMEYAAGALSSRLFVWGSDDPACEDAVLNRYGYGLFNLETPCLPPAPPGGAETVGALVDPLRRDHLQLAGGTIYDLVGNATEWARDSWNRQDEACWSTGGVFFDPVCDLDSPADGAARVFRTGSWIVGPRQASAAYRSLLVGGIGAGQGIDLGFRCVAAGE